MPRKPSVNDILKKYSSRISRDIGDTERVGDVSKEYLTFKQEMMPELSRFEKFIKSFSLFNVNLSKKDEVKIGKYLDTAHLDLTPSNVGAAAFFGAFIVFIIGALISAGLFFFQEGFTGPNGIFLFLSFVTASFVFYYIYSSPARLANKWRLKASSQMVPAILYIVVYMKHTSNLERAVGFASKHLQAPLSLDFKKIFWDVEVGKFSSIKESLDNYLKRWENDAIEFVEAFHLIESSLYEPSESRRINTLEKSLQVILDGVYQKMLVFSREIRSPLTNLYMLGVVLPTLGLALLPLASTLLGGSIKSYHVFLLFNLIIPFFVFYLTTNIIMKRPGGYGESELLELNPYYPQYKSKTPYVIAFLIAFPLLIIGLSPLLLQIGFVSDVLGLPILDGFVDFDLSIFGIGALEGLKAFDFKLHEGNMVGPFGLLALIFSLLIPFSIALFFSMSYKNKTKELIKFRDDTKLLEREFINSLFQLGNRLGDGTPAEVAFAKVATSTRGQKTENFFRRVNINLHQAGMSLERAIFDPRRGAIIYFPSSLIATSMRILLESVKKGLKIAAEGLMSISEYLKNIQKVQQRLNDLLAEVISDMKSNMVFLAPLLSGIVVGLSGMITLILNRLSIVFDELLQTGGSSEVGFGNLATIVGPDGLFAIQNMIPPYYLQIAIGIYIIQVIFILTNVLVTINSGDDRLKRTHEVGKNLIRGVTIYFIVTLLSVLILSILAAVSLQGLG